MSATHFTGVRAASPYHPNGAAVLRALDIVLAAAGLVLLLPLGLVLAFLIMVVDRHNPLFMQRRVGKGGAVFNMYKFRSMEPHVADLPTHTAPVEAITTTGQVLRKYKLDELPQLWNVLVGDMSLVGPRPCLPSQTELIAARASFGLLARMPGLTGPAQVAGIDMSNPQTLAKFEAEAYGYADLQLYLKCLLKTAFL